MGSSFEICEITESKDELDLAYHSKGLNPIKCKPKMDVRDGKQTHHDEHELSRLVETVDRRMSRIKVPQQHGMDLLRKHALKKPMRVGASQASGIGITESVTLKQALRRLCISQASETAAMKRLSRPICQSGVSEAGTIKRLYAAVVVQANQSPDEEKGNLLEISLVTEKVAEVPGQRTGSSDVPGVNKPNNFIETFHHSEADITRKGTKPRIQDVISCASPDSGSKSEVLVGQIIKGKSNSHVSTSSRKPGGDLSKAHGGPQLIKPIFVNKNIRKKLRHGSAPISGSSVTSNKVNKVDAAATKSTVGCQKKECTLSLATNVNHSTPISTTKGCTAAKPESMPPSVSTTKGCTAAKPESMPPSGNTDRVFGGKTGESLKIREKGECSQSSKSSIGDYSCSTSISDESNQSTSSGHGSRPHMSKDFRWTAIHHVEMHHGSIGLNNFKLLKRLGCGDIGTVYLAELMGTNCLFALKVMDNDFLLSRKKMPRAHTEREILQILDHPFLPTLYTYFITDNLSCLVMEYCPGGDLHVLRQRQPDRSFSEPAARFYVAEVLLALEYLHMLGVIYRDLKPENILVREDGHIMLSDFDLSLRCTVRPTLLSTTSPVAGKLEEEQTTLSGPLTASSCMDPLCPPPSCVRVSCFTPRLMPSSAARTKNPRSDMASQATPLPQLVAEPTEARSNSFVGTHEYLAPEIIKGEGHGSSVDWWTLGVFLYELLFGRTPFKGSGNEETLTNIATQNLKFPESPPVSSQAKDLIRGLLVKEPDIRMGSLRGSAEIKQHPFFEGLNWALIRCTVPPETPSPDELMVAAAAAAPATATVTRKKTGKCLDFGSGGEKVEFELF